MNGTAQLQEAIRRLHGCESSHVESVPIKEMFHGKTVWAGTVEVFALFGHPSAQTCYAWSFQLDGGETRYVAILGVGPVTTPLAAVRAAIISNFKSGTA